MYETIVLLKLSQLLDNIPIMIALKVFKNLFLYAGIQLFCFMSFYFIYFISFISFILLILLISFNLYYLRFIVFIRFILLIVLILSMEVIHDLFYIFDLIDIDISYKIDTIYDLFYLLRRKGTHLARGPDFVDLCYKVFIIKFKIYNNKIIKLF